MNPQLLCPYPACAGLVEGGTREDACPCEYRQPLLLCACGVWNRSGARYCRACRAALPARNPVVSGEVRKTSTEFLGIPGSFRRPPVTGNGFLYALSTRGAVLQLSPRGGARAREIGRVAFPAAAFNRYALVDVRPALRGPSRESLGGWNLFAVSPGALEAVSLSSGKTRTLYEPHGSQTLSANHSDADSTGCKGLAATPELVAFVVRSGTGANTLTLKFLGQDRPVLQPLTVHGSNVAGPVRSGAHFALCTEQEVGLYNHATGETLVLEFPRDFHPMLTPAAGDLRMGPGAMPIAVLHSSTLGPALCVAGEQGGVTGILGFHPTGGENSSFRRLTRGSSLSLSQQDIACLCTQEGIDVFGPENYQRDLIRTQPGMPAFCDEDGLFSFGETDFPERHRIRADWGAQSAELRFESQECNRETICGVYVLGNRVLAGFMDIHAQENEDGLSFAHWNLGE